MPVNLVALGLDQLSRDEKLELAGQLWDSVLSSEPPGSSLTDAQRQELDLRVADAKANPDDYVTWEEVRAATIQRLRK